MNWVLAKNRFRKEVTPLTAAFVAWIDAML
jgi:hypothetical protein